jgi:hypothetical protein
LRTLTSLVADTLSLALACSRPLWVRADVEHVRAGPVADNPKGAS